MARFHPGAPMSYRLRSCAPVRGGNTLAPLQALSLSLLYDSANYAVGTWPGLASAGTSGGRNATTNTSDPTVGAALNGIPTVAFASASSQRLAVSYALSTIFTASAWSFWCLCRPTNNAALQVLFSDQVDGYVLMNLDTTPFWNPQQFSGGYFGPFVAAFYAAWTLFQAKYDGTNIKARVNSGAWSSTAVGNIGSLVRDCRIGSSYNATACFDGLMANLGAAQTALSDATFDAIKAALNTRFGLAL